MDWAGKGWVEGKVGKAAGKVEVGRAAEGSGEGVRVVMEEEDCNHRSSKRGL